MLRKKKDFIGVSCKKLFCVLHCVSLHYVNTVDFSRGKSDKKPGSFVRRNAINSAQLHSAAPGDERVDRDNFHFLREYATPPYYRLLIEQRLPSFKEWLKEIQRCVPQDRETN